MNILHSLYTLSQMVPLFLTYSLKGMIVFNFVQDGGGLENTA